MKKRSSEQYVAFEQVASVRLRRRSWALDHAAERPRPAPASTIDRGANLAVEGLTDFISAVIDNFRTGSFAAGFLPPGAIPR